MPAAAVIPAELEMDNFVAVKTYVVTVVSMSVPFGNRHVNRLSSCCLAISASKLK